MQAIVTAEAVIAKMLDLVIHPSPESLAEISEMWPRMNPAEEASAKEIADALIELQKACEDLARRDQAARKHFPQTPH